MPATLRDELETLAHELVVATRTSITRPLNGMGPRENATALAIVVDKAVHLDQQNGVRVGDRGVIVTSGQT